MKVTVVGMGPGHPSYRTAAAEAAIRQCTLLAGARRIMESVDTAGKTVVYMEDGLSGLTARIREAGPEERIAVAVSGDAGFYSLLRYLRKNLPQACFEVIPGISSMQVFFARLGLLWDDAVLLSVHGKETGFVESVRNSAKTALLTDDKWTPAAIARTLLDAGITGKRMAVGERLSYEDERISVMNLTEALSFEADPLCVVGVFDDELYL